MNLRFNFLALCSTLFLIFALGGCTDTPGTGGGNSNGGSDGCPEGQQFDEELEECVASDNGSSNANGSNNQTPNQSTNTAPNSNEPDPSELDPWGDEGNDGIPNKYDNCPFHYNPDQTDTSGDGVGDVCDNCPNHANPDQAASPDNPTDDRGIIMGDVCVPGNVYVDTETDTMGDGVPDIMDICPEHYNPPLEVGCNCPDSDPYCTECLCQCPDNVYPCDGCEQLDSTGDGVGDACDNCPDHFNPNQVAAEGNPTDDRGIVMGNACVPEPNENVPICGLQDTEFEQIDPNIYISLDLSGSMGQLTDSGKTRMEEAIDGMDLIAEELHDEIRFGLGTYPHPTQGQCTISHILDVGTYTINELQNTWKDYAPIGFTPMWASINDIYVNNRLSDFSDPFDDQRVKAVLLITDGIANCSSSVGDGVPENNVVNAISNLYDNGVLTFVVGFNIDDDSLQAYADAGGTNDYYLADEAGELANAMREVADLLVDCSYSLDPVPENEDQIWVSVDGQYLDVNDYSYDSGENLLSLSDSACSEVRSIDAESLELEIKMGCASQCEPEEPAGLCDLWYETCGEEICDPCEPEVCDGTDNNCSGVVDDYCLDCSLYMEPCESTEDCCEPFVCNEDGLCDRECYPLGAPCRSSEDCCDQCDATGGEVGECITG